MIRGSATGLRLCMGQDVSLGEEAVLVDSGQACEKSGFFEHLDRPISMCVVRLNNVRSLSLQKGRGGWLFRCREDHAAHETCAGRGFCFMHNPLQMFLDGVFA